MSIYLGNFCYQVTEEDIRGVFAEYGTVKRVHRNLAPTSRRHPTRPSRAVVGSLPTCNLLYRPMD